MVQQGNTIRNETAVLKLASNSNIIFAAGLVGILATLLIPLPTFLLDIGLACSISLSISILIIVLAVNEPADLSTFPSLLLVTTLFRLALNIASTRLILLQGDAGTIINAFGNFVAGGNLVVGVVMFIIIVVIQFIVVTKGASRISEVSARFVLDAMPGKQMAIDADMNAGLITEKDARERRAAIVKESEFYGAMDGASKFIQGDAKAGLIIVVVNLVGGIILGYSRGIPIATAVKQYSVLSIGDGLVSQIPSIIVAVSAGFLISKIRSEHTVSYEMTKQMFRHSQPIGIAAVIVGAFAFVPGFPMLPFVAIAAGLGYFAYSAGKAGEKPAEQPAIPIKKDQQEKVSADELLNVDVLSILVGVRLIGMVDPRKKSSVFERIGVLRKKLAGQLGIIIPLVRLRDDINLEANQYQIRLYDHVIAGGSIEPDKYLAMDPGAVGKKIKGIATREPVYGLPALWIGESEREAAEINGYTVIDPESVLITHLSETLVRYAHELLAREDVQQLVERVRRSQPSLVGDVVGEVVSVGLLQRVLQNLLAENISIRDLPLILEAVGEAAPRTKNPSLLTEVARKRLMRTITDRYKTAAGSIAAITLEPRLEHQLLANVEQHAESISLKLAPETAAELNGRIADAWKSAMDKGQDSAIVVCDARIRPALRNMTERLMPRLAIAAYDEISPGTNIEPIETVSLSESGQMFSEQGLASGAIR